MLTQQRGVHNLILCLIVVLKCGFQDIRCVHSLGVRPGLLLSTVLQCLEGNCHRNQRFGMLSWIFFGFLPHCLAWLTSNWGFGSSGVFYVHDNMMRLGLLCCAIAVVVKNGVQVARI